MPADPAQTALLEFLKRIPAVDHRIGSGRFDSGCWWIKFRIDVSHPLAWRVVQELGHILNYVSLEDPLPTVFKPVSPSVYMNGGPEDFLSWVIESTEVSFTPELCLRWLEARLPSPVDDPVQWKLEDDEVD
jgi:hypothetical protein